jgi:hypothetical protein
MVTISPTSTMGSGEASALLKVAESAIAGRDDRPVGRGVEPRAPHGAAVDLAAVQVRDGGDLGRGTVAARCVRRGLDLARVVV